MSQFRIVHDGECHSLRGWSEMLGCPYSTAQQRYRNGIRDFALLFGKDIALRPLNVSEQDIEWLRETRYARKGLKNEWQTACELLGINKHRAKELKRLVEGLI